MSSSHSPGSHPPCLHGIVGSRSWCARHLAIRSRTSPPSLVPRVPALPLRSNLHAARSASPAAKTAAGRSPPRWSASPHECWARRYQDLPMEGKIPEDDPGLNGLVKIVKGGFGVATWDGSNFQPPIQRSTKLGFGFITRGLQDIKGSFS